MTAFTKLARMEAICTYAQKAFPLIQPQLEGDQPGAAFTVILGNWMSSVSKTALIGHPPTEKLKKYTFFSHEKPSRAMYNRHSSSFESENPSMERFTGGVYVGEWGFGTSGFKSRDDEAFSLVVGIKSGEIPEGIAEVIAAMSESTVRVRNMLKALEGLSFVG